MATITSTIKLVDRMTPTLNKISKAIDNVSSKSRAIGSASTWSGFNTGVNSATKGTHNLYNALRRVAYTLMALRSLKGAVDIADTVMNSQARINNVIKNIEAQGGKSLYNANQYMDMIYESAQRSRGSFTDMAAQVAKLGNTAGAAFNNNIPHMIAFSELLNKSFRIAGISAQEASNGAYQLTQALAAGTLQGDEMKSILENATTVAQKIADKMGVTVGQVKALGAEGKITSDVIVSAMFEAADEIEERFKDLPRTIGDIWTNIKNHSINAFRPVIQRVQDFINSPTFERFENRVLGIIDKVANGVIWLFDQFERPDVQAAIDKIARGLSLIWNLALQVGQMMVSVAGWIADNWDLIAPIIYGIAIAMLVYKTITVISSIASFLFESGLLAVNKAGGLCLGTMGKIVLTILALVAIIYLAVSAWNYFTGQSVSALGVICGAVMGIVAIIVDIIIIIINIVIGCINGIIALSLAIGAMCENAGGWFSWLGAVISTWGQNVWEGIKQLFTQAIPAFFAYMGASAREWFWTTVADWIDAINAMIQGSGTGFQQILKPIVDFYNKCIDIFNAIANYWNSTLGNFKVTIPDWVPGLGGKSFGFGTIEPAKKASVDEIISGVETLGNNARVNAMGATFDKLNAKHNMSIDWGTYEYPKAEDYYDTGAVKEAWNKGLSTFDYVSLLNPIEWYDKGYQFGEGVETTMSGIADFFDALINGEDPTKAFGGRVGEGWDGLGSAIGSGGVGRTEIPKTMEDLLGSGSSSPKDLLGSIADNTGSSSGSLADIEDTLDLAEEELELLRKIAQQEVINRFTTAEIHVDMTNNNNINSGMDLDGIVTHLSSKLYEELGVVASGVHY